MTKAFVDENGVYLFSFDGDFDGPEGSAEVPTAPDDARQIWDFVAEEWGPPPTSPTPERQPGILAQVRLRIEADVVESASTDGGLSSSSVFEPGLLWCEFPSPIDGEYLVWPSNGATHRCYSLPEEQFPEGFAVRSQSYDGEDTFPPALQILVTKS